MTASVFRAVQYSAEEFVESCGAILFDFSGPATQVCLVHYIPKDEWMLAKGRRNCGESRHEAALREMEEETGYHCRLFPITMPTRAPAVTEQGSVPDRPRYYPNITEPFMVSIREMNGDNQTNIKLIWWYIAEVRDRNSGGKGEEGFTAHFFNTEDAVQKLTFRNDREILQKAVELVKKQIQGCREYEGARSEDVI
ncbi:hypothetical protein S40288_09889 [Stachybotrys chartarum IBT 40288]|nr:hypothetical protein S40288_09889 [Stachybotrys chartarum IBT 40288]